MSSYELSPYEIQLRSLSDLQFIFKDYESALKNYKTLGSELKVVLWDLIG